MVVMKSRPWNLHPARELIEMWLFLVQMGEQPTFPSDEVSITDFRFRVRVSTSVQEKNVLVKEFCTGTTSGRLCHSHVRYCI